MSLTRAGRSLDEELALAIRLVDAASEVALDWFRRGVHAELKGDGSPVTEADAAIETLILAALAAERPDDAVLGEETGAHGTSAWRWIVDPIDGTAQLVAGRAEWGTHVALEHDGEVVVGVISRPVQGRRWWAARGAGAFRTDPRAPGGCARLRVSTVTDLRDSRVSLWVRTPNERTERLERFARRVPPDLNDILRLLDGELEAVVDPLGKPWDHAPAVVLVEEAGGRFTDHAGGHRIDVGEGRYTNGLIDEALWRALGG